MLLKLVASSPRTAALSLTRIAAGTVPLGIAVLVIAVKTSSVLPPSVLCVVSWRPRTTWACATRRPVGADSDAESTRLPLLPNLMTTHPIRIRTPPWKPSSSTRSLWVKVTRWLETTPAWLLHLPALIPYVYQSCIILDACSWHIQVLAEKGSRLNHDELVVYTNDAIRPSYLVMYDAN